MLIGLNGRAGAGKDTVCDFIKEYGAQRDLTVKREAFADRLKQSAARIFFPDVDVNLGVQWCNAIKMDGALLLVIENEGGRAGHVISGREFLQRYGTECHREVFGKDFWIEAALEDLSADITVVTDVRFTNEADAIFDRGGEVWQIIRPGHDIAGTTHASERPLDPTRVDQTLLNNGSLTSLLEVTFQQLDRCLRPVLTRQSA
jgi:hypothetical protein